MHLQQLLYSGFLWLLKQLHFAHYIFHPFLHHSFSFSSHQAYFFLSSQLNKIKWFVIIIIKLKQVISYFFQSRFFDKFTQDS